MNTTNDRWDVKLEDAPQKKSSVPGWVWGCGGGCLLVLLLVIGATWWIASKVQAMIDPENAWPEIAKLMPYGPLGPDGVQADHTLGRPAGITPGLFAVDNMFFEFLIPKEDLAKVPVEFFVVLQPEPTTSAPTGTGTNCIVIVFRERIENPLEVVVQSPFFAELVSKQDATETRGIGAEDFQGRTVSTHHIAVEIGDTEQQMVANSDGLEDLLFVDVTGDRERSVVLFSTGTGLATGSVDELESFLAPFRVWEGK